MTDAIPADESSQPPSFVDIFRRIADNVATVVKGKPEAIQLSLLCLVAEGHLLIEDVPGVGKTSLAKALARSIDSSFGRVQFTPDVLPSDVVGVNIWNEQSRSFDFRPGPVFNQFLLADEINRASPKTQAALLEAMEERQVTIDRETHPLEPPFMVIATQNPLDHEGTYPLPESQLDRFLMRISIGYPGRNDAVDILEHSATADPLSIAPVATSHQVTAMAALVRGVHVAPDLRDYIVSLAEASRHHHAIALGASPRATLFLQRVAQALAASHDRAYVIPDDIKAIAHPVLGHRLVLTPEAQLQGLAVDRVLGELLDSVPVPTAASL